MATFDDFLNSLGGAAAESSAQPWRQHLSNQAGGGLQIPDDIAQNVAMRSARSSSGGLGGGLSGLQGLEGLSGLGGGGGGLPFTAAEIERIADPRLTAGLQMSRSQFETAQQEAQAVGLEDDEGGGPMGLLSGLFRTIDAPRAFAFNAARTLFDDEMGFEEFRQAFNEREGFGELDFINYEDDDGWFERALKGVGAFTGDVLTDPLSLVSFGSATVGKKMGSRIVAEAVSNKANRFFDEDTLGKLAQHSFTAQARNSASRLADDSGKQALKALGKKSADEVDRLGVGTQTFGDLAADSFQLRGSTGLREFLTEGRLPEQIARRLGFKPNERLDLGDAGRKLWEDLPADIRGGLRIRIPFAREENLRRAVLIGGGGGQLAKSLGGSKAVDLGHKMRNAVRATNVSQSLARTFGGANGDIYGQMVADTIQKNDQPLSGMTYGLYRSILKSQEEAGRARKQIMQTGEDTLARISRILGQTGDQATQEQAFEAYHRYVQDPDALYQMLDGAEGIQVDELGRKWLDSPEGDRLLSDTEMAGLQSARLYHDTLRDLFKQAVDSGVDIQQLNDHYLPRALTREKRDLMGAERVGRGVKSRKVRGMNPTLRREQFAELIAEVGEDGVVRSRMRFLSPEQANEAAARRAREVDGEVDPVDFFETDPGVMLTRYVNAMAHIASDAKFGQQIKRTAGFQLGDLTSRPVLKTRPIAQAVEKLDEAADLLRDAGPEVQTQRLRDVLSDMDQVRVLAHRLVNDPTLPAEQQVEEAATLFRAMDSLSEFPLPEKAPAGQAVLFSNSDAEKSLQAAQKAFKQARRIADDATTSRPIRGEVSELFDELGLRPLGKEAGEPDIRAVPPEMDMSYAPEAMRQAINKWYELKGPQAQDVVARWYRPYHSMFKTTATIGRGPGFHIRNALGGMLNNFTLGVSEEDHWQLARVMKARVQAGRKARKNVTDRIVENSNVTRREASSQAGFYEEVGREAEELIQKRLAGRKATDQYSLYDVHRMMGEYDVDWRPGRFNTLTEIEGANISPIGTSNPLPGGPVMDRAGSVLRRLGVQRDIPGVTRRVEGAMSSQASRMYPGLPQTRAEAIERGLDPKSALSPAQRGMQALANSWWIRANAGAAQMTEGYLRGAAFLHGLREYGDPEVARFLPLASQFDYQDLSDFERTFMRGTLLPFYTWTRKNVPFQLRTLFQQPGRMNRLNLLLDNAEEAFGDDEQDVLPSWMRDRFMFASGFSFDGNPLALGIESPAADLNEWFKVGDGPLNNFNASARTALSSMSPALKITLEHMTGTEFFTGAPLDDAAGRHAPWWYQQLPQSIAPTWVDDDGNIMGDGRIINAGPGVFPWLGQGEKMLAIMGVTQPLEGRNRRASDVIRQFAPVVQTATITPQSESGELFQRAARLRNDVLRTSDPEARETVNMLQDMGYDMGQIAAIMQARRSAATE